MISQYTCIYLKENNHVFYSQFHLMGHSVVSTDILSSWAGCVCIGIDVNAYILYKISSQLAIYPVIKVIKTCPGWDSWVDFALSWGILLKWTGYPHSANQIYTHVNWYNVFIFLLDIGTLILILIKMREPKLKYYQCVQKGIYSVSSFEPCCCSDAMFFF